MTGFATDAQGDYIIKDPDADLDYSLKWSDWLNGDTISTATWTVDAGLTKHNEAIIDGTKTTVWLSGGTLGVTYWVSCRVITNNLTPRKEDRSFRVIIVQR